VDRVHDPAGKQGPQPKGQDCSRRGYKNKEGQGFPPDIQIFFFQNSEPEDARLIAVNVGKRFICGQVPVVDHESPLSPGTPIPQDTILYFFRNPCPDRPLPIPGNSIGRDPEVIQENTHGPEGTPLVCLVQENRVADTVNNGLAAVQENASIEYADNFTLIEDRDGGGQCHTRTLFAFICRLSHGSRGKGNPGEVGQCRVLGKKKGFAQDNCSCYRNPLFNGKFGYWVYGPGSFVRYGVGPDPAQDVSFVRDDTCEVQPHFT